MLGLVSEIYHKREIIKWMSSYSDLDIEALSLDQDNPLNDLYNRFLDQDTFPTVDSWISGGLMFDILYDRKSSRSIWNWKIK